VQHTPDRVGAHAGQAAGGTTQCALERHEQPGGRTILLPVRCPAHLLEDALLLRLGVAFGLASAMSLDKGGEPVSVEPCDEMRHRIATVTPGGARRCLIARSVRDSE